MSSRPTHGAAQIPWPEIEAISSLRVGTPADAIDGLVPARVISPANEHEISRVLAWANSHAVAVVACGGRTKISWPNCPQRLDLVLTTDRLDKVIEHAWEDMTVTVQTGCTVATLQSTLAQHGQRLALDALFADRSTIGGIIAANESGALRYRYGSVRDLLIGATVVLADGTIARSGGKVVKNVAGYDLPKLLTGSMGTLGFITEATFRVHPLPRSTRSLTFEFDTSKKANDFILNIGASTLALSAVQMRNGAATTILVDVLIEGVQAGIDAQSQSLRRLAETSRLSESAPDAWVSREVLFSTSATNVVMKFSVLPTDLHRALDTLLASFPDCKVVAQATGLGFAKLSYHTIEVLRASLQKVSEQFHRLGASVALLQCPLELKRGVNVMGRTTDAQPLMLRLKQQFDPNGTLSPGRFLGGI